MILSSSLSTSKRFDEVVLECTDNAYFSKLLYTASECYIRFAVSCGANEQESKCREEMKQIILEENGANLDSISGRKKIFKKIDAWMKAVSYTHLDVYKRQHLCILIQHGNSKK